MGPAIAIAVGLVDLVQAQAATVRSNATVTTLASVADARVYEGSSATNYGTAATLRVDGGVDPDVQSYLRFDVSGINGTVVRATLRLNATSDTVDGPTVAGTSGGWTESGITWANRPPPSTGVLDDEGPVATGSWIELNVSALVTGNGTVDLVLAGTSNDGVDFHSRESSGTTLRPELVVESLPTSAPASTAPPTVSGFPREGEVLAGAPGSWNGAQPMTFAYQWQRCDTAAVTCIDIPNATGGTYVIGGGDVGARMRLAVTATNTAGSATATSAATDVVIAAGDVIAAVAGDIAKCDASSVPYPGTVATSSLLDQLAPDRILLTGDNAYEEGTLEQFNCAYEPTWGRHKAVTSPAVGNHEYLTPGATGYFDYFGAAAGARDKGYYAFDIAPGWRAYALNSNCSKVGGCGAGTPQYEWLRQDLAANARSCVLAYWHHPRFSSAQYSDDIRYESFWQLLYDAKAEIVLNGHDHNYQRYVPLTPQGAVASDGIREFVVGTGGKDHGGAQPLVPGPATRVVANGDTFGILKLTLRPNGYDWRFVPEAGRTFTDAGSGVCLGAISDNTAPTVEAGPDQAIVLPVGAVLDGTVTDDGLPGPGVVTTGWSAIGPGPVTFADAAAVDTSATFSQEGIYTLRLTATDGALTSYDELTVAVTGPTQNAAPVITSNGGGSTASVTILENGTAATDVDAADVDGDTVSYFLAGGSDAGLFSIDPNTGALAFLAAPDYESPTDSGADNVYEVTVEAADGRGGTDVQAVAVGVSNVNEFTPVITSNGGGATGSVTVTENQSAVTTVAANDGDGDLVNYAIVGGADRASFALAPGSGVLTFVTAPDFESPMDANRDNVYEVDVAASDGTRTDSQSLLISVTDLAETGTPLYLALESSATLDGVAVANEDVVFFDGGSFTLMFDGSDVGLSSFRIDAFARLDADSLLLSVSSDGTLPTFGAVDDSDVLRFDATSLGSTTSGTFSMYFDGSDVGLTTSSHDVDAVELLSGQLLISTAGSVNLPGVSSGRDEDLLLFSPSSLGTVTSGSYSLYFDGSDVGLGATDVDGAAIEAGGTLYLSTADSFAVAGASGDDEDVVAFVPTATGATTAGTYLSPLDFDGSAFGLGPNDVVAVELP